MIVTTSQLHEHCTWIVIEKKSARKLLQRIHMVILSALSDVMHIVNSYKT